MLVAAAVAPMLAMSAPQLRGRGTQCPGPYGNPVQCTDPTKPKCCQMREDLWQCIGEDEVCCAQSLSHGIGAVCQPGQQCCFGFSYPACYDNTTQVCCSGNQGQACPANNTCGGSPMSPSCVAPSDPVDCDSKYTTQDSCDADDACAWCDSAAVPGACNTLADAKSLPPSVFSCDKV